LLERVRSESSQHKLGEEGKEHGKLTGVLVNVSEREVETGKGVEEVKTPSASQPFQSGIVMDINSFAEILKLKKTEYLSQAFVSATVQAELDLDAKIKYRIGVIALTPIEIRLAEDLASRIAAKRSTGEALLIAKKIKAKDVLVSDSPKIISYQGVRIHNLKEFLQQSSNIE